MPPHQHHLVNLGGRDPGVLHGLLAWSDGLLYEVSDQLFHLRAAEAHNQVLRAGGVGGDERQVDLGLHQRGKLDLRAFGGLAQALESHPVLFQVNALLFLELRRYPVNDAQVEVVAAQMGVARW